MQYFHSKLKKSVGGCHAAVTSSGAIVHLQISSFPMLCRESLSAIGKAGRRAVSIWRSKTSWRAARAAGAGKAIYDGMYSMYSIHGGWALTSQADREVEQLILKRLVTFFPPHLRKIPLFLYTKITPDGTSTMIHVTLDPETHQLLLR